ncbi:FAD-dependent monooxygenase [Streptomyces sp. NPDC001816]|uniref:aromatic-ring hydroxylase C-terminal domain-containing protein n=1 Tax=Streptomyces sp. NPDC001816 TaxID=3364612 RepID=UPI0036C69E89
MNTGLADVHLCWKLAGVLRGWAEPGLLETYERERHPVAHRTLRQAVANTKLMVHVLTRRRAQLANGASKSSETELPWAEWYFAQLGLVLGVTYRSPAVLTGNSTPPELSDGDTGYVPTAEPGHRMPHFWLTPDRSTLDAFGEWFTLLTPGPTHWTQHTDARWPLRIEPLPKEHADLCGINPQGALLIRPDGHIGARWQDHPSTDGTLRHALASITCSAPS